MTNVMIRQPGYMPNLGFFKKIQSCDIFVFLDDAQFAKDGFDNRNRIKSSDGVAWITVPLARPVFGKKMNEVLNDIESMFGNNVDKQTGSQKRREDKIGKSIMYYNDFQFSDQSAINIYCTDWSKEITDKNNWLDELKISLYSVEFANYLSE